MTKIAIFGPLGPKTAPRTPYQNIRKRCTCRVPPLHVHTFWPFWGQNDPQNDSKMTFFHQKWTIWPPPSNWQLTPPQFDKNWQKLNDWPPPNWQNWRKSSKFTLFGSGSPIYAILLPLWVKIQNIKGSFWKSTPQKWPKWTKMALFRPNFEVLFSLRAPCLQFFCKKMNAEACRVSEKNFSLLRSKNRLILIQKTRAVNLKTRFFFY